MTTGNCRCAFSDWYMIPFMPLRKVLIFSLALSVLTGLTTLVSILQGSAAAESAISRFLVTLVFTPLGLRAAFESQLRGSIVLTAAEWSSAVRDLINFGILPGLVLGLVNYFFFYTYRYSPFVTARIRDMSTFDDAVLLSLESGLIEEVVYRLFILSCFYFVLRHLYRQIKPSWLAGRAVIPEVLSLVVSSLLFAVAHNPYGFTAAFSGGILLGIIYLRSGIESSIAAHFSANLLFYSASYII